MSGAGAAARHGRSEAPHRATYQDVLDAPAHRVAEIYAREGVEHLWLVDPTDRTLEALEMHEGRWVLIATAKDTDPVCIRPFDAITFSLGDLWP